MPLQVFLNPYLIARGRKVKKYRRCAKNGSPPRALSFASISFQLSNNFKMVKKRVRDADVLPEGPVQASTQDDDSGSDEVKFRVTSHSTLLMGNRTLTR